MAYILTQQLQSGMSDKGIANSSDIDDAQLNKTQQYLNSLFNQGKGVNAEGKEVQVGKSYTAGDGIEISSSNAIGLSQSVKNTLNKKQVTLYFGENEETLTLALMFANMKLTAMKTKNVSTVKISYGDTLQKELTSSFDPIDLGTADFMVIDIVRTTDNTDAVVGFTFTI